MAIHDFFSESARRKVEEAVARAEQRTSAELVVTLRKSSASYRAAHLLFGALAALVTLALMLFLPREFPLWSFVVDVVLVFGLASALARLAPVVARTFTPEAELAESVHAAAAATFLEKGVHHCHGRNGVLVYVSVVEQRVELVPDVAVDPKLLEPARKAARDALTAGDLEAFVHAIESLGPALAESHPRMADDTNELPDEVVS